MPTSPPLAFMAAVLCLFPVLSAGKEWPVPTKKAERPRMDPKPQLPEVTHRVYIDLEVEGMPRSGGRIILGLFGQIAPKTVENFRALCACDKGKGKMSGKQLCYKGSRIHRIMPNFMIQGGDITHGNGVGGESIYGGTFDDEIFHLNYSKRMLLSMANHGPNTNGSQFFINTVKTRWLDNKNVAFGTVLEGQEIVEEIQEFGTLAGEPQKEITISDSGEL